TLFLAARWEADPAGAGDPGMRTRAEGGRRAANERGGRAGPPHRRNGPAARRVRGHQAAERRRSGAAVQPMMHRFAYVGNDLQDLFGINPRTIGTATPMSDAFFQDRKSVV